VDAGVLLGHVAVLKFAEGRPADAARLRAVADATMSRLGLTHWPMLEDARLAAMGGRPIADHVALTADALDADPWEELRRALPVEGKSGLV
jgi:hypothetical protein